MTVGIPPGFAPNKWGLASGPLLASSPPFPSLPPAGRFPRIAGCIHSGHLSAFNTANNGKGEDRYFHDPHPYSGQRPSPIRFPHRPDGAPPLPVTKSL